MDEKKLIQQLRQEKARIVDNFCQDTSKMLKIDDNNDESILYHYTTINGLQGILENKSIWFSHGRYMNDSSDLIYFNQIIANIFDEIRNQETDEKIINFFDNLVWEILKTMQSKVSNVFVFSATTDHDSLVLWSNYSNYIGYNIGFNIKQLKKYIQELEFDKSGDYTKDTSKYLRFINKEKKIISTPALYGYFFSYVQYDTEKCRIIVKEHLQEILDICKTYYKLYQINKEIEVLIGDIISIFAAEFSIFSVFFKNPLFKQENEYRIAIIFNPFYDEKIELRNIVKYRISNGIFIPYIEITFEEHGEKLLPIETITIGPKNNIEIAKDGIQNYLCSLNYNLGPDQIKKSEIPFNY